MDADYDIEALQFATGREAFDYCDGPHDRFGGRGVAIQAGGKPLVIDRLDAQRLQAQGLRIIYLREIPLMKGDGTVVCGMSGTMPGEAARDIGGPGGVAATGGAGDPAGG